MSATLALRSEYYCGAARAEVDPDEHADGVDAPEESPSGRLIRECNVKAPAYLNESIVAPAAEGSLQPQADSEGSPRNIGIVTTCCLLAEIFDRFEATIWSSGARNRSWTRSSA